MSTLAEDFYLRKEWRPDAISYSLADMWYRNPAGFRAKYYWGKPSYSNPAFEYGSIISDMIKNDPENPLLNNVIKYPMRDEEYWTDISGVPFVFHPDTFHPDTFSFREYKTTTFDIKHNKLPWDDKKVKRHIQLDCYSLGIETLFGKVNNVCHLDCLIKEKKQLTDQEKSLSAMTGKEPPPALFTGQVITFERNITDLERYRAKEWLLQAFYEIKNDYEKK